MNLSQIRTCEWPEEGKPLNTTAEGTLAIPVDGLELEDRDVGSRKVGEKQRRKTCHDREDGRRRRGDDESASSGKSRSAALATADIFGEQWTSYELNFKFALCPQTSSLVVCDLNFRKDRRADKGHKSFGEDAREEPWSYFEVKNSRTCGVLNFRNEG